MAKENNYINKSEDYELEYALYRNGKRATEFNIEMLKFELGLAKLENNIGNLKHEIVDEIIENSDLLEDK